MTEQRKNAFTRHLEERKKQLEGVMVGLRAKLSKADDEHRAIREHLEGTLLKRERWPTPIRSSDGISPFAVAEAEAVDLLKPATDWSGASESMLRIKRRSADLFGAILAGEVEKTPPGPLAPGVVVGDDISAHPDLTPEQAAIARKTLLDAARRFGWLKDEAAARAPDTDGPRECPHGRLSYCQKCEDAIDAAVALNTGLLETALTLIAQFVEQAKAAAPNFGTPGAVDLLSRAGKLLAAAEGVVSETTLAKLETLIASQPKPIEITATLTYADAPPAGVVTLDHKTARAMEAHNEKQMLPYVDAPPPAEDVDDLPAPRAAAGKPPRVVCECDGCGERIEGTPGGHCPRFGDYSYSCDGRLEAVPSEKLAKLEQVLGGPPPPKGPFSVVAARHHKTETTTGIETLEEAVEDARAQSDFGQSYPKAILAGDGSVVFDLTEIEVRDAVLFSDDDKTRQGVICESDVSDIRAVTVAEVEAVLGPQREDFEAGHAARFGDVPDPVDEGGRD